MSSLIDQTNKQKKKGGSFLCRPGLEISWGQRILEKYKVLLRTISEESMLIIECTGKALRREDAGSIRGPWLQPLERPGWYTQEEPGLEVPSDTCSWGDPPGTLHVHVLAAALSSSPLGEGPSERETDRSAAQLGVDPPTSQLLSGAQADFSASEASGGFIWMLLHGSRTFFPKRAHPSAQSLLLESQLWNKDKDLTLNSPLHLFINRYS